MMWLLIGIPCACFFAAAFFRGVRGCFWAASIGLLVILLLMMAGAVWVALAGRVHSRPTDSQFGYVLWGGLLFSGYWLLGGVVGGCLGLIGRAITIPTRKLVAGGLLIVLAVLAADLAFQRARGQFWCPGLERLKTADAAADANAAHARGDDHLIMLGGLVGSIPGASESVISQLPHVMLEETSDTTTEACDNLRPVAERYAPIYNSTIAGLIGVASGKVR
jgi:hypothetical protein